MVCATVHEDASSPWVELENGFPVGVSVRLDLPLLEGLEPSRPVPIELRLAPGRSARAVTLESSGAGPARYQIALRVDLGSPDAVHDRSARYALPFGGSKPRVLVQGSGGTASHVGPLAHAFDFEMPEGTPVLAARAGVVVQVRDGFPAGVAEPTRVERANKVVVAHEDGTLALYAHLRQGIRVRVGDPVRTGERLGLSGASGYASGPHLHFHVWKRAPDGSEQSLPIRFAAPTGGELVPATGRTYGPGEESSQP